MKSYIPNAITLLNLFFGCLATVFAIKGQLEMASFLVFAGIFCDFFDGLAARLLHVQSPIGVQLDSLADLITCGLVPGIIMFQLLSLSTDELSIWTLGADWGEEAFKLPILPALGFVITLASAYRLARFNIDEDQHTSFIGLPTPANTLLIVSLPLIHSYQNDVFINNMIMNTWVLLGITAISAWLLNARIHLFALKFTHWGIAENTTKYIFLFLSAVLLVFLQFAAIPLIIVFYMIVSLISYKQLKV